jgi:pimeloyl-ACP methyl ester carboxylesterase
MPYAAELHYRRSAPSSEGRIPLVLIHGAGGSYLHWPAEIRHLTGEDILAIDLPGHGASEGEGKESIDAYTDSVHEFLDCLDISQAVIAGHSMGSAIAQRLSLDSPERVRGLIQIGAGAKLSVHPKLIEYCSSESTYPEAVSLVMEWAFSSRADRRLVELAGQRMAEMPASVLQGDFLACDAFDVRDQVGEIEQPALVICGAEDQMTPVRFSEFLSERLPKAGLEIVPNAGHMVMLEQSEIVAELIINFLKEINSDGKLLG